MTRKPDLSAESVAASQRLYYSIGEVSALLRIPDYTLRRWERQVPALAPPRRSDRRFYRHADLLIAQRIRDLLARGMTLRAVRANLARKAQPQEPRQPPPAQASMLAQVMAARRILHEARQRLGAD